MKYLLELQQEFIKGFTAQSDILTHIEPHPKNPPSLQFSIYKNAFISRLQKTLKNIYPVCYKLLADDFFLAMAREYILQTPSCSRDLNDYGETFPTFIREFAPAKSLPYLADVACLEWAWHFIYAAPDNPAFNFEKLAASYSEGENILFLLPSRSTLLSSPYPLHRIWEINQDNFSGDPHLILNANEMYYFVVWRKDFDLRIDLLTAAQWEILCCIQKKFSLLEICDRSSAEINTAEMFSLFVSEGWISAFQPIPG